MKKEPKEPMLVSPQNEVQSKKTPPPPQQTQLFPLLPVVLGSVLAVGGVGFIFRKPLQTFLQRFQKEVPPVLESLGDNATSFENNATPPTTTLGANPSSVATRTKATTTRSSGGSSGGGTCSKSSSGSSRTNSSSRGSSTTSPPAPSPASSGRNLLRRLWPFSMPKISMPQWKIPTWGRSTATATSTSTPPAPTAPRRRSVKWGPIFALIIQFSTGATALGATWDHFASSGRGRQCAADFVTHVVNPSASMKTAPPIEATTIKKTTTPLVRVSQHLLPELKYTNNATPRFDAKSLKIYKILDLEGNPIEIALYKAVGMRDKYFDQEGNEYMLLFNKAKNSLQIKNKRIGIQDNVQVFHLGKNQYLITQPYADFEKSKAFIESQGLELIGIIGTGPIKKHDSSSTISSEYIKNGYHSVGYNYFNPKRLTGKDAPVIENGEWFNQQSSSSIQGGHYTLVNGEIKVLDFYQKPINTIRKEIEALKQRNDVLSISLTDWTLRENQWTNRGHFTPQVRFSKAFDKNGNLLGLFITPPVGVLDSITVAKSIFGDSLGFVVRGDDDFYAKSYLFFDPHKLNDPLVKHLIAANWIVQAKNTLPKTAKSLKVTLSDCAYNGARWNDRIGDVSQRIQNGSLKELWDKIWNHT